MTNSNTHVTRFGAAVRQLMLTCSELPRKTAMTNKPLFAENAGSLRNVRSRLFDELNQRRPAYRTKVFGIGFPKTGTSTLGKCMSMLGYKHSSHNMVLAAEVMSGHKANALEYTDRYESFEDWPWFVLFRELSVRHPRSVFVHTIRSSTDVYLNSLRRHRERQGCYRADFETPPWWSTVFGHSPDYWNAKEFGQRYEQHNKQVTQFFKKGPGAACRFETLCWEDGHGWEELCNLVGRKAPAINFPHANRAK